MAHARFIVPQADSDEKPAIYQCLARVVDRRFTFKDADKEQFRTFSQPVFVGDDCDAGLAGRNQFHRIFPMGDELLDGIDDHRFVCRIGDAEPLPRSS